MNKYYMWSKWKTSNRLYNPLTNRKIKMNGRTYKKVLKLYKEYITQIPHLSNRLERICPLSMEKVFNGFEFNFMWDPLDGSYLREDYLDH